MNNNMEYLNELYITFIQEKKIEEIDLKRVIFICCHSQHEPEILAAKMILSKIGENTKIENNQIGIEEIYKNLLNEHTRRTFKGAYMP